jgi:hypothetical protein
MNKTVKRIIGYLLLFIPLAAVLTVVFMANIGIGWLATGFLVTIAMFVTGFYLIQ